MTAPVAAWPRPRLQPMRWWHLPAVAALESRIFGSTAWPIGSFYAELVADGRWLRVLTSAAADRHDAEGQPPTEVFGYVDVAVAGRDADLMTIAVAPEVRRTGWARAMMREAIDAAAAAGATAIFLEVRADNPARHLYADLGFSRIDTRKDYYGPGEHALVMRRRISREVD